MMFQDVIMSVFGILILIVLFLIFNIRTDSIESREEKERALNEILARSRELNQRMNMSSGRMLDVIRVTSLMESEATARGLGQQVEAEIEALTQRLDGLQNEIRSSESTLEVDRRGIANHPLVVDTLADVQDREAELRALQVRKEDVIDQKSNLESSLENRLVVQASEEFKKYNTLYFVELMSDKIILHTIRGESSHTVEFSDRRHLIELISQSPGTKHVMIFVRPSGIREFEPIQIALRKERASFGYQPIPESEQLSIVGRDFDPTTTSLSGGGDAGMGETGAGSVENGAEAGAEVEERAEGEASPDDSGMRNGKDASSANDNDYDIEETEAETEPLSDQYRFSILIGMLIALLFLIFMYLLSQRRRA